MYNNIKSDNMGMGEEWIEEHMHLLWEPNEWEPIDISDLINDYFDETLKWESSDGRETLIKDLHDMHLQNIINLLREKRDKHPALGIWYLILYTEYARRRLDYKNKVIDKLRESKVKKATFKRHFAGPEYNPVFDAERLSGQMKRVYNVMKDGHWRTLREIEDMTKDPSSSISAQLRHLRKDQFGAHTVNKRRRGEGKKGLYEYQLEA
jgi:hypothetical protein